MAPAVKRRTRSATNGNGTGAKATVEVLQPDFSDPVWKLDEEMTNLLRQQKLEYEVIKVPIDMVNVPEYGRGMYQVRNWFDQGAIDSYAAAILRHDKIPTGTVDLDLDLIDLYHRAKAAEKAGVPYLILIRVQKVLDPMERGILANLRNSRHGLRPTSSEVVEWALTAVAHKKWSIEYAAEQFNVDPSALRRALAVKKTQERAQTLNVEPEFAELPKTVRYALANSGLHNDPFKGLVKVLGTNSVTANKASALIQEVAAAPSDREALRIIKRIKDVDLAPPTVGGTPVRTLSFDDAARRFLSTYGPFKTLMQDTAFITALLSGPSTDPKFSKIHDAIQDIEPNFQQLVTHFGV